MAACLTPFLLQTLNVYLYTDDLKESSQLQIFGLKSLHWQMFTMGQAFYTGYLSKSPPTRENGRILTLFLGKLGSGLNLEWGRLPCLPHTGYVWDTEKLSKLLITQYWQSLAGWRKVSFHTLEHILFYAKVHMVRNQKCYDIWVSFPAESVLK